MSEGGPARWHALRVGPGGTPPDEVAPVPDRRAFGPPRPAPSAVPSAVAPPRWSDAAPGSNPPVAMTTVAPLGSFDEPTRPRRGAAVGYLTLAVAALIVVATALWSSADGRSGGAAQIGLGDCLSSVDDTGDAVVSVDCASDAADFRVTAREEEGPNRPCTAVRPDAALATEGGAVLCVDYVARVGECLFAEPITTAGSAPVGKRPCSEAYAGADGLFRVVDVVPGGTDESDCPIGTLRVLRHQQPLEVVCLGFP